MDYSILVVDDNRIILTLVKHFFEEEQQMYSVTTAMNGQEAIQIAIEQPPDIILMDLDMPVMNGIEALQRLKSYGPTRDIPVIIITASKNLEEAFENGAIDFIRKPIDKTELIVRVKSTLSMFRLLAGITKQAKELEQQSRELEQQKSEVEAEKKRTDDLLLNILPYEVAEQLKNKGTVKPKKYRMVSVLFTDFMGFTKISEQLSTDEIVHELGIFFEKFDEIIGPHYIEKIKTIGDAYMCVGGLPIRNKSNPIDTVLAGLQIQKFVTDYNTIKESLGQAVWSLRLGIHTGQVVAGVIGKKKFAYDIWGDTVNTASRMESSGEMGKVNISGSTYSYIKDFFDCEYRGKIKAKNKGEIDMYFVNRLKPKYSSDELGIYPNSEFDRILSEF